MRRKYFGRKIGAACSQFERSVKAREDRLEALFRDMDAERERSREVFKAFRVRPEGNVDWVRVHAQAQRRDDKECAICLQALGAHRETTLLSCSHVFHAMCIQGFEYYDGSHTCPVCREHYTRTVFE